MFVPNYKFPNPAHRATMPGRIRAGISSIYTKYRKPYGAAAKEGRQKARQEKNLGLLMKRYERYVGAPAYVEPEKYGYLELWKAITRARLFFETGIAPSLLSFSALLERIGGGGFAWKIMDTPLKNYAFPMPIDMEGYLASKVEWARAEGRRLKILDVGMGTGAQWVAFLEKYCDSVYFIGTVLNKSIVKPSMQQYTVESRADNLRKNLIAGEKFDIVLSHCGMHLQELSGMREIYGLLPLGGEVLAVGLPNLPLPRTLKSECPGFEILERFGRVAYHLRKAA
jgi:hypothetical protein